jgi:phosphoserine phosphatase
MRLAIFDVDGTLSDGTVAAPLPELLHKAGLAKPDRYRRLRRYVASINPEDLEREDVARCAYELYASMIEGVPVRAILEVVDKLFVERRSLIFSFSRDLIAILRERGYTPVLLSAGPHEVVERIAAELAVPHHWGTSVETRNGRCTGRIKRVVSGRKGRLVRQAFGAAPVTWQGSLAVGNSAADIDLLEIVGRAVAFEPTSALHHHAVSRGWQLADRHTLPTLLLQTDFPGPLPPGAST